MKNVCYVWTSSSESVSMVAILYLSLVNSPSVVFGSLSEQQATEVNASGNSEAFSHWSLKNMKLFNRARYFDPSAV